MKRSTGPVYIVLVCGFLGCFAAALGVQPIPIFATGVDPYGNIIADSTVDPHWQVTLSDDFLYTGPQAYTALSAVFPIGPWLANTSTSKWIKVRSDSNTEVEPGTYVYTQSFDLTGLDPATAQLSGQFSSDDWVDHIELNGVNKGQGAAGYSSWHSFSITGGFTAGLNTLSFYVVNDGTSANPQGFRAEAAGTAEVIVPPDPAVLSPEVRWRMDDNADNATVRDGSSNRNGTFADPTNPNTSYHHRTDRVEGTGSLSFDGNDYIQVYGYKGISGSSDRSCTAWVKLSAIQQGAIVCWGTSTTEQKWIFRVESDGALGVGIYGGWIKTTTAPLNDFQWHHAAVTFRDDGTPTVSDTRLYIDGIQQPTTISTVDVAINTGSVQDVMIGAHREDLAGGGTPNMFFKGQMDDVHLYTCALSADAILEIKNWGPSPADYLMNAASDTDLGWISQPGAFSYDVYLGTSQSAVAGAQRLLGDINADGPVDITDLSILANQWLTNGSADIVDNGIVDMDDFTVLASTWGADTLFKGNLTGTTFDPGPLAYDTTYYWRIDKVDASDTTPGVVWSFSTLQEGASDPTPADGADDVSVDTLLSWLPGVGATGHQLYFGTDSTPDSSEYIGDLTEPTYDPDPLEYETTYYWRIDEINAGGTTTGTVWSFTTKPRRLTPEEFPILPWSAPNLGHSGFSSIYDCGFNLTGFVFNGFELDIAVACDLKVIFNDIYLYRGSGVSLEEALTAAQRVTSLYKDHPGLFGYYLMDEPSADLFGTLGNYVSAFRTYDPDHIAYINLFPNYATSAQMGVSTYQQYVDSYLSTVQPDFISYDNYNFYLNPSSYFSNLQTIRTAAKNNGIPFWSILYSCKASGQPTPSPATLRFQLYTSLAYGAEGISWFLYFNDDAAIWSLSPIDINGSKTATWYYLRDVNLAMHKIGPTYLTLNNVGYYHGSSPSGWSISGSDLLVGDFDQIGTGQSFVMVVNKSLTSTRTYTVSESLPGSVYYVSPVDGQFYLLSGTLVLQPGEGRLLTVQ